MSSITRTMNNLQREGPLLDIYFSVPAELERKLKKEGKQVPESIHCKALIDTGASNCVVQANIPQALKLNPIGETTMATPSCQSCKCYTYLLRITIPQQQIAYECVFTSAPLQGQEINCLIGRDILSQSHFTYIGYMNQFTFSI
ncbi:MAG: hypothetical protein V1676_03550 [Candidatus Diapherotrites archaeon]